MRKQSLSIFLLLLLSMNEVGHVQTQLMALGSMIAGPLIKEGIKMITGGSASSIVSKIPIVGPFLQNLFGSSTQKNKVLDAVNLLRTKNGALKDTLLTLYKQLFDVANANSNEKKEAEERLRSTLRVLSVRINKTRAVAQQVKINTNKIIDTTDNTYKAATSILANQRQAANHLNSLISMSGDIMDNTKYSREQIDLIRKDLGGVQQVTTEINGKMDKANNKLDVIVDLNNQLEKNMIRLNEKTLNKISKSTEEIQESLNGLGRQLKEGFVKLDDSMKDFARSVDSQFQRMFMSVQHLEDLIVQGFDITIRNLLEESTAPSRTCARNINSRLEKKYGDKTILQFMLYPRMCQDNYHLKAEVYDTFKFLDDHSNGIEACINEFQNQYNPAQAYLQSAKSFFHKRLELFKFKHREVKNWTDAHPLNVLKQIRLQLKRFLMHHLNLYTVKTAYIAAKIAATPSLEEGLKEEKERSLKVYTEQSVMIANDFAANFPPCNASKVIQEAYQTYRLYCDTEPLMKIGKERSGAIIPTIKSFPVGTKCTFFCYFNKDSDTKLKEIACGPEGQWSLTKAEITANYFICLQNFRDEVGRIRDLP